MGIYKSSPGSWHNDSSEPGTELRCFSGQFLTYPSQEPSVVGPVTGSMCPRGKWGLEKWIELPKEQLDNPSSRSPHSPDPLQWAASPASRAWPVSGDRYPRSAPLWNACNVAIPPELSNFTTYSLNAGEVNISARKKPERTRISKRKKDAPASAAPQGYVRDQGANRDVIKACGRKQMFWGGWVSALSQRFPEIQLAKQQDFTAWLFL